MTNDSERPDIFENPKRPFVTFGAVPYNPAIYMEDKEAEIARLFGRGAVLVDCVPAPGLKLGRVHWDILQSTSQTYPMILKDGKITFNLKKVIDRSEENCKKVMCGYQGMTPDVLEEKLINTFEFNDHDTCLTCDFGFLASELDILLSISGKVITQYVHGKGVHFIRNPNGDHKFNDGVVLNIRETGTSFLKTLDSALKEYRRVRIDRSAWVLIASSSELPKFRHVDQNGVYFGVALLTDVTEGSNNNVKRNGEVVRFSAYGSYSIQDITKALEEVVIRGGALAIRGNLTGAQWEYFLRPGQHPYSVRIQNGVTLLALSTDDESPKNCVDFNQGICTTIRKFAENLGGYFIVSKYPINLMDQITGGQAKVLYENSDHLTTELINGRLTVTPSNKTPQHYIEFKEPHFKFVDTAVVFPSHFDTIKELSEYVGKITEKQLVPTRICGPVTMEHIEAIAKGEVKVSVSEHLKWIGNL